MESQQFSTLLDKVNGGDSSALQELVSQAYPELCKIAGSLLRNHRSGRTLQRTVLVNEAYLRLANGDSRWQNKGHFFGAAARAMRQVLIGYARQRSAKKRVAVHVQMDCDKFMLSDKGPDLDVARLDEALSALELLDPELVRTMELRYFAGRSLPEIADLMDCSLATVKRRWTYARAWLHDYLDA